jgi:hypothetical protein
VLTDSKLVRISRFLNGIRTCRSPSSSASGDGISIGFEWYVGAQYVHDGSSGLAVMKFDGWKTFCSF